MFTPRLTALNRNEALLYLGYKGGGVPPETAALLDRGEAAILSAAVPRCTYRILPLTAGHIEGCAFQPQGQDIAALLADCSQIVLLCATLGAGVDRLLLQAGVRDMAEAVVLDAFASVAVEAVCDQLEGYLSERFPYLTDRFSPGYGDMPLTQQPALCAALDAQRQIGLTVSAAGLLTPGKSVTALMGVASRPQTKRARGCQHCNLFQNCPYRKDGKTCGN